MQRVGRETRHVLKRAQMPSHEEPCVATTARKLQSLLDGNETAANCDAMRPVKHRLIDASFDGSLSIGVKGWCRISSLPPQLRRIVSRTRRLEQAWVACDACFEAR
jgi:hypothetical protein